MLFHFLLFQLVMDRFWRTMIFNVGCSYKLQYCCWDSVSNAENIQMQILSKDFPCILNAYTVFIDCKALVNISQIEAAVTQALIYYIDKTSGGMHTRELTTEILYCLSPNRSIKHAMDTFGIQPSTKQLIVGVLHSTDAYNSNDIVLQDYLSQISKIVQVL
ncbi:unnamed protein product [Heterobilharzia americana]|nr:unnamed protein product [Heterobilharzia americana]